MYVNLEKKGIMDKGELYMARKSMVLEF